MPPEAIGKVEKVVGHVTLIHNGVAGPLHVGDPVYKTDIVETAANSSCGIAFPDGTALDLVNNTRMALNEYNYEATAHRTARSSAWWRAPSPSLPDKSPIPARA